MPPVGRRATSSAPGGIGQMLYESIRSFQYAERPRRS
jgi:hypothetical protein